MIGEVLRGYGEMTTSELKTRKWITAIWALQSWRVQQSCVWRCGPHYYFCASDAPVSRSCKTYPVTQTKQNNWTGEASLRPGKGKMRSRVLWRHLEGIWWNNDIGAEEYKRMITIWALQSWKLEKRMTTIWALHFARNRRTGTSTVVCDVAVRTGAVILCLEKSKNREVEFDRRGLEGIWWNDNIGAEEHYYYLNDYDLSFTELKSTTRLCVTLRSALFALLLMPR